MMILQLICEAIMKLPVCIWIFKIQILQERGYFLKMSDLLTDDAWVSGPDLAPQKFLLSQ